MGLGLAPSASAAEDTRLAQAQAATLAAQAALNADPADLSTAQAKLAQAKSLVDDLIANPPAVNAAPAVNAGADATVTLPATAALDGTVTDDGLPYGSSVTTTWSKVSGPGTVTFADAAAPDPPATFSAAGDYVLRLTAGDGALSATDDVAVHVAPAPPPAESGTVTASATADTYV